MHIFLKLSMIFFICIISQNKVKGALFVNILNDKDPEDFVKYYIPTINAKNELCRNHSLFYLEELKQYKLWATEMFDATTKFPTGFLQGSNYDFGHFDECIDLNFFHNNDQVNGRYCMVTVKIMPSSGDVDYTKHYLSNYSMWSRITDYLRDPSKNPRNELGFAFCMPSSCTPADLRETLSDIVAKVNQDATFELAVEVDEMRCQVKESFNLNYGDIAFLSLITLAIVNVAVGSLYDYMMKRKHFHQYKLKGNIHNVLLCFSVQINLSKLTTVKNDEDGLNSTAGMKVFSMFLAIMLHRIMFDSGSAIYNSKYIESMYSRIQYTALLNGPILVDTFFTISGFLASYLSFCYYHKAEKNFNILRTYFHRYIRMTCTYWIILLFYCTIFVKLGSGPLWRERIEIEQQKCRKSWWANLLFINNYFEVENYCMFQSWYVACDMNGFLLVPLLTLLIFKKQKTGIITVLLLIVASCVAVFVTVYIYDEHPIMFLYMRMVLHPSEDSNFVRIYIPGHLRVSPYFVGILGGYLKYRMNLQKFTLPTKWLRTGWTASVLSLILSLHIGFFFYIYKISTVYSALYASIHRLTWSLGIMWIILVLSSGHTRYVNTILSWSPLVVLSRLSYTVYLCHGAIQMFSAGTIRHPVYTSMFNLIHSTVGDIILAYSLALVLTLLFESPIVGVEKIIRTGEKTTSSPKKNEDIANIEITTT